MPKYQNVFKRCEIKYLVTKEQQKKLLDAMACEMTPDEFGKSTVSNIYFDTPSKLLIRRSIDKPIYKEKLRIRSYGAVHPDDTVFVEIKKKFDGVVYKRRAAMSEKQAMDYACRGIEPAEHTQIIDEIDYFLKLYRTLEPSVFISYDRTAFYSKAEPHLRITFDENILWRGYDLSLEKGAYGQAILGENEVLMEIKASGAMPLWLTHALNQNNIRKTSFSKYGNAYAAMSSNNKRGASCA